MIKLKIQLRLGIMNTFKIPVHAFVPLHKELPGTRPAFFEAASDSATFGEGDTVTIALHMIPA